MGGSFEGNDRKKDGRKFAIEGESVVMRVEATGKLDELEGVVENVAFETNAIGNGQYKITIRPTNVKVKAPSGCFFEWIPMSKTATEEQVPQGSVMERFLTQLEICLPAAKRARTLSEAFGMLKGKKFAFHRVKLGKDFDGHPAREYLVPVRAL